MWIEELLSASQFKWISKLSTRRGVRRCSYRKTRTKIRVKKLKIKVNDFHVNSTMHTKQSSLTFAWFSDEMKVEFICRLWFDFSIIINNSRRWKRFDVERKNFLLSNMLPWWCRLLLIFFIGKPQKFNLRNSLIFQKHAISFNLALTHSLPLTLFLLLKFVYMLKNKTFNLYHFRLLPGSGLSLSKWHKFPFFASLPRPPFSIKAFNNIQHSHIMELSGHN